MMSKSLLSVSAIAVSGVISIFTAIAWVNFGAAELGAIIYLARPLVVALASVALFLAVKLFTAKNVTWLTIALVCINILTGCFLRLDYYHHFVNWSVS